MLCLLQSIPQDHFIGIGAMVAVRDKVARLPLSLDYDGEADVLYAHVGAPVPSEGEDRPRGIVLRFSMKDDAPTGVTVLAFRRNNWHKDLKKLSEIISDHLAIDVMGVRDDLQRLFKA
jgi:hypothetical protein